MDVRKSSEHGWIEVITGSMFSGKSEELIRRLRRAQIARQKVQIFKPLVDNRFSDDHIVSHSEQRIGSTNVNSSAELVARVDDDTEVIDDFARDKDVRSGVGAWGILSDGLIDRTRSFEIALLNALAPFLNGAAYE